MHLRISKIEQILHRVLKRIQQIHLLSNVETSSILEYFFHLSNDISLMSSGVEIVIFIKFNEYFYGAINPILHAPVRDVS